MFRQVPDGAMEKQNRSFVPMLSTSYRSDVASHREASEKVKTLIGICIILSIGLQVVSLNCIRRGLRAELD